MSLMPIVYICSPYKADTPAGIEANLARVRSYCRMAVNRGFAPLATHLAVCSFLNDNNPDERALGLTVDAALMNVCDELWVFGDRISEGMAIELDAFRQTGKPIRRFTEDGSEKEES